MVRGWSSSLTSLPLSFGPADSEDKLDGLPVAMVSAESSPLAAAAGETAEFLRRCGASVTEIRLGELGIHGNGHAMMLEKNNAEVASVITEWVSGVQSLT